MGRAVTALDFGHEAIKAVTLRLRGGLPELELVAVDRLRELGRIEDSPEKLAALRSHAMRLVRDSRVPMREVIVPVSGRTTILRYIHVPPVPPWRLDALMRFEAVEQSGQAEKVAYDHRMLDVPDASGQMCVLLAVSQEATVAERVELASAAGAEDPDVELAALGLYAAYVHGHGAEDDEGKTVMLLDVGAEEMQIVITCSGGLYFARHQPGGGRRFTKALSDVLGISWQNAEVYQSDKARIYADPADAPGEEERKASEALEHEAADIARAVEATLLYARAQTKLRELKVDRILLSGGGAALAGFGEFMSARLEAEVAPLEPFRKVSLGDLPADSLEAVEASPGAFAVPVGLALSRLMAGAARLDLRRAEAKAARAFRQRDLYLYASAAAFVLGLVFWIAGTERRHDVWEAAASEAGGLVTQDAVQAKTLAEASRRNRQGQAELRALRERINSGEDLLRVLSQLKKQTPNSIRLTGLTTGATGATGGKNTTFQTQRRITLAGYARSGVSYAEAIKEVVRFKEALKEAPDLFKNIDVKGPTEEGRDQPGGEKVARFGFEIQIADRK